MQNVLIEVLAFLALLSSVLVITSKNPVIAVIFLVSLFINVAGYLILTGVGFIGITYIILYVGAITVLFLFVIMMINIKLTDILETGNQYTKNLPLGIAIGSLFLYEVFSMVPFSFNNVSSLTLDFLTQLNGLYLNSELSTLSTVNTAYLPAIADQTYTSFTQIQAIGQGLYTYGALWLIICSIILLLAMIAPIFISRNTNTIN